MNHAILLAGGIGSRMKMGIPKQYVEVKGIPVFIYSFRKFAAHPDIDSITIVCAKEWTSFISEWIQKESFKGSVLLADAGISRQHSIYNGLLAIQSLANDDDCVLIHDSVRPLFPLSNISDGILACQVGGAALPVIAVKDATYLSVDGVTVSGILPRHEMFSGQSPECFNYKQYLAAHSLYSDDELAQIRGSAELAFRAGIKVMLIPGSECNFKITTIEDLKSFELLV